MQISKIDLDEEHWTSDYIPISYTNYLTRKQLSKSVTFYWATDYDLHATCRAYFIDDNRIEIGDIWLSEEQRGKKIDNVKISVVFMRKVISKIWQHFKSCSIISLLVHNDNIPAIKLYEKLNFVIEKQNIRRKEFNMKNGLLMIRHKQSHK